jgi:hypothetical protein
MSTGIVLPALNVNAVAPAFSISTLGFMPPNPAVAMSAMHPLRLRKYAEGYWREMMIKHMRRSIGNSRSAGGICQLSSF